jgi:hypothetical protein
MAKSTHQRDNDSRRWCQNYREGERECSDDRDSEQKVVEGFVCHAPLNVDAPA